MSEGPHINKEAPFIWPSREEVKAKLRQAVDTESLQAQKALADDPNGIEGGLCEYRSRHLDNAPCAIGYLLPEQMIDRLVTARLNQGVGVEKLFKFGWVSATAEERDFAAELQEEHDHWAAGSSSAFLCLIDHPDPDNVPYANNYD